MVARVKSAKPTKVTTSGGRTKAAAKRPRKVGKALLRVLVLSGPNLHRLGKRQPEIYGTQTLDDVHELLRAHAEKSNCEVTCHQSNYEGDLVGWIGEAKAEGFSGVLINPGALTHTSYALYDALLGAELPAVELHLTNPDAREAFRRKSTVAPACVGRVAGFGASSYLLALDGLLGYLARQAR